MFVCVDNAGNSSLEGVVDSFLLEVRKCVLSGEFRNGYRAAMRLACDISIVCSLLEGVPIDVLIKEYFDVLKERSDLVGSRLCGEEALDVYEMAVDKSIMH
jgi:hypothetical protein